MSDSQRYIESPLTTLVRRTSSRRIKPQPPPTITVHSTDDDYQSLPSPLLHGRFGRDSTATASSYEANSYLESESSRVPSFSSSNVYPELDYQYHYDDAYEHSAYEESIYSQPDRNSSAIRDSWRSTDTVRMDPQTLNVQQTPDMRTNGWGDDNQSLHSVVPSVFATSSEYNGEDGSSKPGRAKITAPVAGNFSRPLSRPTPPPVHGLEEQKRQVLLRNASRRRSQSPPGGSKVKPSPLRNQYGDDSSTPTPANSSFKAVPTSQETYNGLVQHQTRLPVPPAMTSSSRSPSSSSLSPNTATSNTHQTHLSSSRNLATDRPNSPLSLYSNYSYYPFESAVPSPTGSTFSNSKDPFAAAPRPDTAPNSKSHQSKSTLVVPAEAGRGPKTAHDYLLLGIEHHEHDRLKESARCFEQSAKEGGGCGVGMLMWGLTLRHGWGCEKNEKMAFKWLQKAAESAVGDLEATRAGGIQDASIVRNELVLAIYEVGQCFFQGWGVPKDQKMAVSYYTIAAELGDADAQMDLAFCLTNGKGCKKNKHEAAKWYRAAIKQGQSDVGLAWIYKDKYQ